MPDYDETLTEKRNKTAKSFEYEYYKDYESDWDIHKQYIQTFDAYEAMLIGQVYDSVSNSVDGSKITDSYTTTLAVERSARVMGKLPDGVIEAIGKADQGKAAFMDILRQKWIYPNANSQFKFKRKLGMWQLYADVYGYMPMYYDWNISKSGYVGPDCWLWNPRNLVFQQGRISIGDMDYVTSLTWVGKKFIENLIDNDEKEDGWNREALKMLLDLADEQVDNDAHKDTKTARDRVPQATKKGICLATRFEAGIDGRWCTFAPDHSNIQVRELKNPHQNGRIPFVIKYSQELFDSVYGLGDFQRAKPLQFARDGLTNFYFTGIKMNLVPPIVVNANGVIKHTVDYRAGGVIEETIPQSVRRLETSTAGLATYQAAQSALTGSLLSLFGSQNASLPGAEALNPSQGKTPAAINLYSNKEASRDGQAADSLEQGIEELTDGFFSLVVNIGTESIPVNLFEADIQAIVDAGMEDVMGLFSGKFAPNATQTGGELKIDPKALKGVEYRFNINPGSTQKISKDQQREALEGFIGVISKLQNVLQDDPRVKVEWPEIMKAYEGLSDIPGVSKFITIDPAAQPPPPPPPPPKPVSETLAYKDAGPFVKAQIEEQAGMQPDPAHLTAHNANIDQMEAETQKAKLEAQGQAPEPQQPAVAGNGMSFNDPHLAEIASQIHKQ